MLSSQVFDIHQKVQTDETIERIESRTYHPFVKSFLNNDVIEITINQADAWLLMYDAVLCIKGTSKKTAGNGDIAFVNNAGAFLFETITYELNGKEVDSVRNPGILSTFRGYLCYQKDDSTHMSIAGWNFPLTPHRNNDENGTFSMRIPLAHFLNIFNDYKYAMCGKHTIRLVRARSDNNCLEIKELEGIDEGTTKVDLKVDSIELKVKHIIPNDAIRLNLLQSIKDDRPIFIPYHKWSIHERPALTAGATREIWPIGTSASVECPRYVIVAFQKMVRIDNLSRDPTRFDNIDITDIKIYLNTDYYPHERMRLDFGNNDFAEAFNNYVEFYPSYANEPIKRPTQLDYAAFKNRALFVIDCSRRVDTIKSSTVDIKLEIEAAKGFPANTRAYCVIIHDRVIESLPLSEIVRNVL